MKGLILPLGVFATGLLASACCGKPQEEPKKKPSSDCNSDPKITMAGFNCYPGQVAGSVRQLLQRSPLYSRATSLRVTFDYQSGNQKGTLHFSKLDMSVVVNGSSYHWGTGYSDSDSIISDVAEGLKNLEQTTNPRPATDCSKDSYIGPTNSSR